VGDPGKKLLSPNLAAILHTTGFYSKQRSKVKQKSLPYLERRQMEHNNGWLQGKIPDNRAPLYQQIFENRLTDFRQIDRF
jgi:hypothetical protein